MDQALDEMVSATRNKRNATRGTRGGARGGVRRGSARDEVLGRAPASPTTRARAAAASGSPSPALNPAAHAATKIIVSNLPIDVNEVQVKELFSTTVGPTRGVNLSYDHNGKSKGVAEVIFQKQGDASKAYTQYNKRLIDGSKPMKIEIIVDPSRVPAQPLTARVTPAAAPAAAAGGAPRGRGTGRGRGAGRRKTERTPKSAADLDAEMEDYTATNPAAAPAAAAEAPAAAA